MANQSLTPSRPPAVLQLTSRNRTNPTDDPAHCTLSVTANQFQFVAARLKTWIIPTTCYNIRSGYNTFIFGISYNSGSTWTPTTITITPGQYSASQLATAIQTQCNTAAVGLGYSSFTCTYSTNTFSFTCSLTPSGGGGNGFSFYAPSAATGTVNWMWAALGLPYTATAGQYGSGYSASSPLVFTLPFVSQLSYPEQIFARVSPLPNISTRFQDNNNTLGSLPPIHFVFPNRQSGGSLEYNSFDVYDEQTLCFHGAAFNLSGQMTFDFYGPDGQPLSFNGADWFMDLELHYSCCCKRGGKD